MRIEFRNMDICAEGQRRMAQMLEIFSETLWKIEQLLPPSHELSLVVTKLQEASFFAVRGVAIANPVTEKEQALGLMPAPEQP